MSRPALYSVHPKSVHPKTATGGQGLNSSKELPMQDLPDLVIANATVVNADGRTNAHVLVTGGTIVELLEASIWARTFPRSRERR